MKLYYWRSEHGNFGDDLNEFLWSHFVPDLLEDQDDGITLFGVGSILADFKSAPRSGTRVVMGSGAGYGQLPADLGDPSWRFYAVRGPLTARLIGCEGAAAADPAILLPLMPDFPAATRRSGTVFVPHWQTASDHRWRAAAERAGVELLDPRGPAREVIARLGSAEHVLAESMHAAIIADAFRTPWTAVVATHSAPFKWHDWALALQTSYDPLIIGDPNSPSRLLMRKPKRVGDPQRAAAEALDRHARSRRGALTTWSAQLERRTDSILRRLQPPHTTEKLLSRGLTMAAQERGSLSHDSILCERQANLLKRFEALRVDYKAGQLSSGMQLAR